MFLDGTFYDICTAISSKHETNKMVHFTTSAHQPLTAKRVTLFQHMFFFLKMKCESKLIKISWGKQKYVFLVTFFFNGFDNIFVFYRNALSPLAPASH